MIKNSILSNGQNVEKSPSYLVPAEGVCGLTQGHFNVIISLCLHQVFQGPLVPWGIAPKIVLLMAALELMGFPDQRGWVIRIRNVNQSPTLFFFVHGVQDNVWKAWWLVAQSGMWWNQISSCLNQAYLFGTLQGGPPPSAPPLCSCMCLVKEYST